MVESGNTESNAVLGGIVTAKGTSEGLILRIDGRVADNSIQGALEEFITSRESFLSGNSVILEWVGKEKEEGFVNSISSFLDSSYKIKVKTSRLKSKPKALRSDGQYISDRRSLFDGMEQVSVSEDTPQAFTPSAFNAADGVKEFLLDEPDARVVYGTLRSGQKIETDHSLIIIGDINSGAEVIAGGDVVVLGNLRGVAHAGAFDETGGGCFIFAISLKPTQLRIGNMISRGEVNESGKSVSGSNPEIARVDGTHICVEPYNSRKFSFKDEV